jgi:hypothetical protein
MPLSAQPSARREDTVEYYYRRPLSLRELIPAVGVAISAGLFAFYITRLLLQRTPLKLERPFRHPRTRRRAGGLERSSDA